MQLKRKRVDVNQRLTVGMSERMTLLSTREVAEILGVEVRFVRHALLKGVLKGFRVGERKWRVRVVDLQEYIAEAIEREQCRSAQPVDKYMGGTV